LSLGCNKFLHFYKYTKLQEPDLQGMLNEDVDITQATELG